MTDREKSWIGSAMGLDEHTVEEWWDWMSSNMKGRWGLRIWIRARELEMCRKAKLEGRY